MLPGPDISDAGGTGAFHMPKTTPATTALRKLGIDTLTAQEAGLARASDEDLLRDATSLGRVLMTQDQDFLAIGANWQRKGVDFPGIIYVPQGVSYGIVISEAELLLLCGTGEELRNQVYYLPLS